ncbi:MAG: class IV adenylate cyclase [Bacteroidales bacterium]|nr:class IV adenylate cyclase [Bacteroidales bacterium]
MSKVINIEIKAQCYDPQKIREVLFNLNTKYIGLDHQVDTYFIVKNGRLKLREGNIENNLIHYDRENISGPKTSNCLLYKSNPDSSLKEILVKSLGVFKIVEKDREIFFVDNVKIHIDKVKGLGSFVEIEAISKNNDFSKSQLLSQCKHFLEILEIKANDLIPYSYSDM